MAAIQMTGDKFKGWAIATTESDAEAFAKEKRALGFKVRLRRKYETFLGERLQVDPPQIRIYFEP